MWKISAGAWRAPAAPDGQDAAISGSGKAGSQRRVDTVCKWNALRLTELPAFGAHHLLECETADILGVTDEGDLAVLTEPGCSSATTAQCLPPSWAIAITNGSAPLIPLVGLAGSWCVAMRRRTMRCTGTVSSRKSWVCALAHAWQSSPGRISSKTALGARSLPAAIRSSTRMTNPGKIAGE